MEIIEDTIARLGNDTERNKEFFEICAQTVLHYCTLLTAASKPVLLPNAIRIASKQLQQFIEKSAIPSKLYLNAFKFYVRTAQIIEEQCNANKLLKLSEIEQICGCRLQGIECKIKGLGENPKETLQVMVCALYSLNKTLKLEFADKVDSIEIVVTKFLRKFTAVSQSLSPTLSATEESVLQFNLYMLKLFSQVSIPSHFFLGSRYR